METLIAYSTRYGCVEKCAKMLAEKLDGKVTLVNLQKARAVDPAPYERVIVGGSLYIGKIQKEVRDFCLKNAAQLKQKKSGYFICGMREEEAAAELNGAFPPELLESAAAKDYFGGEFNFKKMKALDRFIVKKVSKVEQDLSSIAGDRIDRFARSMNNA